MKKLIIILLTVIVMTAAHAQEQFLSRETIARIASDTTQYNALVERFLENDNSLSPEEYAYIYYGFALQESFKGYIGYEITILEIQNLLKEDKKEEAKTACERFIKEFPVSPTAWWLRYMIAYKMDEPDVIQATYFLNMLKILSAVMRSGDGKTQETGFRIISLSDEYRLMYVLQVQTLKSRESFGETDCFNIDPTERFDSEKLWFDKTMAPFMVKEE